MTTDSNANQVLAALDLIASSPDTAAEVLDSRIDQLQAEIRRLRSMRKLIGKGTATKPMESHRRIPDVDRRKQEQDVIDYITKHGAAKPADIGEALGTTAITVGRIVAGSDRLAKDGYKVIVVQ